MSGIYLSLIIIALTIYAIRVLPFLFIRKPIKSRFVKSFLYYVPYVTRDLFITAITCCAAIFIVGLF